MIKISKRFLCAAIFLVAVTSGHGAVVVNQFTNLGGTGNDVATDFAFDTVTATSSVLLVAIAGEQSTISSVAFNGVTVNTPVTTTNATRESYIFAIDLGDEVATTGQNITITGTSSGGSGYWVSALQVSNADFSTLAGLSNSTTGSSTSAGADTSIAVPSLAAGSLVLDVLANNQTGNTLTSTGLTRTTTLAEQSGFSTEGMSSLISNTTGNGNIGWTNLNGNAAQSAIWISAIPEPSLTVMLALGGMGLLMRRRRH